MGCGASATKFTMISTKDLDKTSPYYLQESGCPYAKLFSQEPKEMRAWRARLDHDFEAKWKADGSPQGPHVNDHRWAGHAQGNTIGFFAGSLEIGGSGCSLDALPAACRVSLYAKPGKYPAVVRYSDIDTDGSEVNRLSRMAVKAGLPADLSWCSEANWTMVESFDEFCVPDFTAVQEMSEGQSAIRRKLGGLLRNITTLSSWMFSGDAARKTFYGQLPYRLGDAYVHKYRFVSLQTPGADVKDDEASSRAALRDTVAGQNLRYQLELQVVRREEKVVSDRPADKWTFAYVPVGILTIPAQPVNEAGASIPLTAAIEKALNISASESAWIHKMFQFHPLRNPDACGPFGETQQFRSHFYVTAAKQRFTLLGNAKVEPKTMPFPAVVKDADAGPLVQS